MAKKRKHSILKKFNRLSGTKKLLVFVLSFAVIGGGIYAYSSFAASNPVAWSGIVDVGASSGLWDKNPVRWYGSFPADVDNDGDLDVFLNAHEDNPGRLMMNDGKGQFSESTVAKFPTRDRHGCDWGDVNEDGRLDMYCSIGAVGGTGDAKSNELWIQNSDGSFTDKATAWHVNDPWGRGRMVTFLDVNHDKHLDLYVTNAYPRKDNKPTPNRLYLNIGGRDFEEATKYGLTQNVGGVLAVHSCVQSVDYDNDSWTDLLVCGFSGIRLYHNDGGENFTNKAKKLGIMSGQWYWARLIDMNGDGRLDLAGLTDKGFVVQLGKPVGFAKESIYRIGRARQVAFADVNGDKYPDAYIVTGKKDLGPDEDSRGPASTSINDDNPPDLLLKNSGDGQKFTSLMIPQVTRGDGDHVTAANFDQDPELEFIVGNGFWKTPGPLQLLNQLPQ